MQTSLTEVLNDLQDDFALDTIRAMKDDLLLKIGLLTSYESQQHKDRWSGPQNLGLPIVGLSKSVGSYLYVHVPTGIKAYNGIGNISQRVRRFKDLFAASGSLKGSSYHGAQKCYDMDPDINNWEVYTCAISLDKSLAKMLASEYEVQLHNLLNTQFNDPAMTGKG